MPHKERAQWDSGLSFILTCIGYAVGLGNIWRFPSLAYEHGGGAFLIPYVICSMLVGFPMLYLEMSLGQYSHVGPAVAYGRIRPIAQGIGWSMAMMSLMVSIYYNVIVAWVLVYLFIIVSGRSGEWASCTNPFNTIYCSSSLEDDRCIRELGATNATDWAFYFNGTCHFGNDTEAQASQSKLFESLAPISPAEEFFENYILEKSPKMEDFGGFNIKIVIALFIVWTLTAVVLARGVKIIGKVSWITATVPYCIIVVLFIRGNVQKLDLYFTKNENEKLGPIIYNKLIGNGVTLDGARIGFDFYLLKPDLSVIIKPETWRAAATHLCYSLAIGFGGLLSLSSFNRKEHNCFKDAFIISFADGFMSVFGGTAVFSVLGFMSKQLNAPINTVVQSGTGLAFVAYPEAMSRMPFTGFWSFLFFLMLFILGISSQFGLAEVAITAIYDQFGLLRRYKTSLSFFVCGALFLAGLAGIYYFNIFNDYSASFSLMLLIIMELFLIVYIYGLKNYMLDLRSMFGQPKSVLGRLFGPTGRYIRFAWRFIAPIQISIIFFVTLFTQIRSSVMTYGKDGRMYFFPDWAIMIGWAITLFPLLLLPIMAFRNALKFKNENKSFMELFKLQAKWPSYERIKKEREKSSEKSKPKHEFELATVTQKNGTKIAPVEKSENDLNYNRLSNNWTNKYY